MLRDPIAYDFFAEILLFLPRIKQENNEYMQLVNSFYKVTVDKTICRLLPRSGVVFDRCQNTLSGNERPFGVNIRTRLYLTDSPYPHIDESGGLAHLDSYL